MRAILFDLDGTLLDIDMDEFLRRYFAVLAPVVGKATGLDPRDGLAAVLAAVETMCDVHPGVTNRDVFQSRFEEVSGARLDDAAWAHFDRFYAEEFPLLGAALGPHEGARAAVETALSLGVDVAIATNPIFPSAAVNERLRWAGLSDLDVHLVTTYEDMSACKPHAAYYSEVAARLGRSPRECLMVGDDASLDMSAADVGMKTFYVGPAPVPACDWSGTLEDLTILLPRIVAET